MNQKQKSDSSIRSQKETKKTKAESQHPSVPFVAFCSKAVCLFLCAFVIPAAAATNDLTSLLQRGLFEEEANRNLDAAITNYESLAKQFDKDRQIAATAVFRLGECYRKLGKTNEAVLQYERILRDFSDQQTLATLSRQNLAGLGSTTKSSVPASIAGGATLDNLQSQYALLKAQLEQARKETNFLTIAKLLNDEDLRETLRNARTVIRTPEAQQEVFEAAGARALDYAEKRLSVLQSAIQQARTGQSQTHAENENSAVTDDEEKEIRRIQAMIQNSPDLINAPIGDDGTPLFQAAKKGQLRVAAFLLDHGAEVNGRSGISLDRPGGYWTPLMTAVESGHKAMAELLLQRGAQVNANGGSGTPLHIAVQKRFKAIAEVLLRGKANVNAKDGNGATPLHEAVRNGSSEFVKLLLDNGAELNATDNNGRTPLNSAIERGNIIAGKTLIAFKADPNIPDRNGRSPLSYAAGSGNIAGVELLLGAKADPNAGTTNLPLASVIEFVNSVDDQARLCDLLLRAGADPNKVAPVQLRREISKATGTSWQRYERDKYLEVSPIQLAVERLKPAVVKMLLDHGANPNSPGVSRATLLWSAGDKEIAEALLAHGADVNAKGAFGETALHLAWKPEIVELLLANNAEVNVRDSSGRTPLDWVKSNAASRSSEEDRKRYEAIASILRAHGALDDLPDFKSIRVDRQGLEQPIIVYRADANGRNRFTLFETILSVYSMNTFFKYQGRSQVPAAILEFPALDRVIVHRPAGKSGGKERQITVNLLNATNGVDCAKDMTLEFGDVVEIPMREHALNAASVGLRSEEWSGFAGCLKRSVQLKVRGQSKTIEISPIYSYLKSVLSSSEAQSMLLSSSDLSRVKVTGRGSANGKPREWLLDCTADNGRFVPSQPETGLPQPVIIPNNQNNASSDDLWLRDGDVIEVPEK